MPSSLLIEQHLAADPDRAFASFTSADALSRWWWPHIPDTAYAVDGREGGTYDIRSAAAGIGVRGTFIELDPPRSIRMTWSWMDEGVSSVEEEVTITFAPDGDGTRLTLTHQLAPQSGDGEALRQGWNDVLARLADLGESQT